LRELLER